MKKLLGKNAETIFNYIAVVLDIVVVSIIALMFAISISEYFIR